MLENLVPILGLYSLDQVRFISIVTSEAILVMDKLHVFSHPLLRLDRGCIAVNYLYSGQMSVSPKWST